MVEFRDLSPEQIQDLLNSNDLWYIEELPDFDELYEVRKEIDRLPDSFRGLTQGHDVIGRATDLLQQVENVREKIMNLVLIPKE